MFINMTQNQACCTGCHWITTEIAGFPSNDDNFIPIRIHTPGCKCGLMAHTLIGGGTSYKDVQSIILIPT
ncbi:hypothetical protein AGABI1DRAFT_111775 [Agaricus bisporus var. burnettii JB137-S8]|uniref:Uncharacterized protein n=1 Tax=Agaricus bisporus var. burnettii (strain JB137-S8 / ATCC MYA-4627 / FGSC 10392) TaxID=597362 RepID=K5Y0Y7_AGABU|nr:uncharacterized protein AGABI1DRAFT_111775 [Agaricus bisporus var. burnettii JB137-S8]EKM81455.1 hypothetical protein AGABI1DRAFT_111775 [Agaricus bisporus var. burnettii JB137-S8]